MRFNIIIKQQGDDRAGDAGDHDLEPERNLIHFNHRLCLIPELEREHLAPKQDDDRQNSAQLDDHKEHFLERIAHLQRDELIHEQHVARAADGQPFRNALHDTEENDFQYFDQIKLQRCILLCHIYRLSMQMKSKIIISFSIGRYNVFFEKRVTQFGALKKYCLVKIGRPGHDGPDAVRRSRHLGAAIPISAIL